MFAFVSFQNQSINDTKSYNFHMFLNCKIYKTMLIRLINQEFITSTSSPSKNLLYRNGKLP